MKLFRIKNLCLLSLGGSLLPTFSGASSHSLTCLKHVEAVEGAAMKVLCQSEVPINSCAFDFPTGFKKIKKIKKIKMYAGVKNQNYESVVNYKKGECGIRFSAMKRELEGLFTVEVTFPDEDAPAKAEINVTMLYPPVEFHLESNRNNFEFNEGDEMIFTCSSSMSNPSPKMSLCIGDDGPCIVSYQTSMNASKTAEISDFDKKVVCVVHHPLLDPQEFTLSKFLTILHKPKTISKLIHEVGRNISINMTVSAYPKPHTISLMRNNGSYVTLENSWLILVKDTHCIWEVGLNMSEITEDDLNHGFELTIANSEGLYTTKVIPEAKKDPMMFTLEIVKKIIELIPPAVLTILFWKRMRTEMVGTLTRGINYLRRKLSATPDADDASTSNEQENDRTDKNVTDNRSVA